jgi:carbonic anhydrase
VLKVADLIVMGHAQCGGIGALLRGSGEGGADFVAQWMKIATQARDRALTMTEGDADKAQTLCEHEAVKVSLEHLLTFPWLRERVESGDLKLHGFYFGIESGELLRLDKDGKFRAV